MHQLSTAHPSHIVVRECEAAHNYVALYVVVSSAAAIKRCTVVLERSMQHYWRHNTYTFLD